MDSAPASGSPCAAGVDVAALRARNPRDLWRKVCGCVFPPEVGRRGLAVGTFALEPLFF